MKLSSLKLFIMQKASVAACYLIACLVIFHDFLSSADFFQNLFFQKILTGTLSECQTVWIHIRTDFLSVLTCVQTVCKGYQQTTKVDTSKERVRLNN